MLMIRNQQKAFQYKKEYDLAQQKLNIQIEHYQKLYDAQREIGAIRHDIRDKLTAISGLLSQGNIPEAIAHITGIVDKVEKKSDIIDTGHPPIDAVINAKITKAEESDIYIKHKLIIENPIDISQLDIALLIANALDNAIKGILRSTDVERFIKLDVTNTTEYISILVENQSSGPVYDNFQTSKPEKINHGFGLEQMKAITKKYNGDINPKYNSENYKFTLEILLKNKAE